MRKRPESWTPPGPKVPGGLLPEEGETLDCLSGNFKIFQLKNGHRYSTDDLLVAWYLGEKTCEGEVTRHLDLGSGIGSVGLLVSWLYPKAAIVGVEAQEKSASLARKSAIFNGVEGRFSVVDADFRDGAALSALGAFPTATGSPPYFLAGEGRVSDRPQRGPCRFEERGGAQDYLAAAAGALSPSGLFVWVNITRQREKNIKAAVEAGFGAITAKNILFSEQKPPLVTLFSARLGSKEGFSEEEPLPIRLMDGSFSPRYKKVREKMGFPA